jgi:hypothetical protein
MLPFSDCWSAESHAEQRSAECRCLPPFTVSLTLKLVCSFHQIFPASFGHARSFQGGSEGRSRTIQWSCSARASCRSWRSKLQSPSEEVQLDAVIILRTLLLSKERNPPVVAIPGVVARLVQLLSNRELHVRGAREKGVNIAFACVGFTYHR